jgi:AcrR family transcriptional regulator
MPIAVMPEPYDGGAGLFGTREYHFTGMEVATTAGGRQSARERILETAYELFSRHGTRAVGVDRIIAECGIAKMTLYRNFASKDALIIAFLERRDELWTRAWLQAEAQSRGTTPADRLLAIFDVFDGWFAREDFEGCSFINVMLECADEDSAVRQATVRHLADIRVFVAGLADEAGVRDPDGFARQWHILMKGSIVSAAEGDAQAASRAKELGRLLLEHNGVAAAAA